MRISRRQAGRLVSRLGRRRPVAGQQTHAFRQPRVHTTGQKQRCSEESSTTTVSQLQTGGTARVSGGGGKWQWRQRRRRQAVGAQGCSTGSAAPGAAGIDRCLQCGRLVARPRGLGAASRGAALRRARSGRPCSQKCNQDLFEEHHRVNERRDAAGVMHGPAPASPADGGAGQCMCAFSAQLS